MMLNQIHKHQTRASDGLRPNRPKRRARLACLGCRSRKVRCNVEFCGHPCTNCYLDNNPCITRAKKKSVSSRPKNKPSVANVHQSQNSRSLVDLNSEENLNEGGAYREVENLSEEEEGGGEDQEGEGEEQEASAEFFDNLRAMKQEPPRARHWSQYSRVPQSFKNALLPFSYYPYIRAPGIQQLQPAEMAFLESQKSTHIPTQPLLDELLKHYFLYVHPSLPLIDEGKFWSILEQRNSRNSSISILVFQAMLFVACGYIPLSTAKEWGATSILEMRASFYKRAKTLYDFGVEKDPLCRSQALALLSYESSSSDPSGNSTWLALAIQYARMVNANAYDHMPKNRSYKKSSLKRLWWCLILRDRIIALGMRRPLQILPSHFCVNSASNLELEDLQDEINASKVYNPRTKRTLGALLSSQCRLAAVLTPLIMILHPSDSDGSGEYLISVLARADDVKTRLKYWHSQHLLISPAGETEAHQSITLFKQLNKLYYESARLALDHHLAFCLYQGRRLQSLSDLMEAVTSIHAIFKRVIIDGTASHLPISVVAFGILPQMLMNFDLRLSHRDTGRKGPKHLSKIYQELNTLHRLRYDTSHILNWMNEIFIVFEDSLSSCDPQHAVALATEKQSKSHSLVWMINLYPEQYFRLLDTMNSAVSTGQFTTPTFKMIATLPYALATHSRNPRQLDDVPDSDSWIVANSLENDLTNSENPEPDTGSPNDSSAALFSCLDVTEPLNSDTFETELSIADMPTLSPNIFDNFMDYSQSISSELQETSILVMGLSEEFHTENGHVNEDNRGSLETLWSNLGLLGE